MFSFFPFLVVFFDALKLYSFTLSSVNSFSFVALLLASSLQSNAKYNVVMSNALFYS